MFRLGRWIRSLISANIEPLSSLLPVMIQTSANLSANIPRSQGFPFIRNAVISPARNHTSSRALPNMCAMCVPVCDATSRTCNHALNAAPRPLCHAVFHCSFTLTFIGVFWSFFGVFCHSCPMLPVFIYFTCSCCFSS